MASLAERSISHDLLRDASGLSAADLDAGLREAVSHHLLVADPAPGAESYAFRHALLREAVHDDLLPGERVRLHSRLAALLARRDDTPPGWPPRLARHSLAATTCRGRSRRRYGPPRRPPAARPGRDAGPRRAGTGAVVRRRGPRAAHRGHRERADPGGGLGGERLGRSGTGPPPSGPARSGSPTSAGIRGPGPRRAGTTRCGCSTAGPGWTRRWPRPRRPSSCSPGARPTRSWPGLTPCSRGRT